MNGRAAVISDKEYDADIVLQTALDVGEHLLKNGSEIARVEDTIERICLAYGAEHVESFSITTLITASVRMKNGSYSEQMRHVKNSGMNLYRVEQLNKISRDICCGGVGIEEARERIKKCKKSMPYPQWVTHIGAVLLVAGFTVFFGGDLFDAAAAAVIALIVSLISSIKLPFNNGLIQYALSSFIAGSLSALFVAFGFGHNLDAIIIGTIMLMIPGLAVGTAISDMVSGNLISGALKFLQSVLTAVLIALGYTAALLIIGGVL